MLHAGATAARLREKRAGNVVGELPRLDLTRERIPDRHVTRLTERHIDHVVEPVLGDPAHYVEAEIAVWIDETEAEAGGRIVGRHAQNEL